VGDDGGESLFFVGVEGEVVDIFFKKKFKLRQTGLAHHKKWFK
jgi:hypothetical protein